MACNETKLCASQKKIEMRSLLSVAPATEVEDTIIV